MPTCPRTDYLFRVCGGIAALFSATAIGLLTMFVMTPTLFLGWEPSAISSGSMEPRVERGDVVLFDDVDGGRVRPGSVVLFALDHESDTIVHRVESVDDDAMTYRTKGDANPGIDSSDVPFTAVRGVGTVLVPLIGWPIVWLHETNLPALASVLLATISVGWFAAAMMRAELDDGRGESLGPLLPTAVHDAGSGLFSDEARSVMAVLSHRSDAR